MEPRNHLGIYLRKDRATVVNLAWQGRDRKLLDCFSISIDGEEPDQQVLADRIVQVCRERRIKFAEAAVALDGAAFMQHTVHSEFGDPKRIAATVRFDTEEALATDVSDVAVAFRIVSSGEEGSSLDVFTAERAILSDILLSLQSNGIDPVTVDPDVCCLSRYLLEYTSAAETPERSTLYAMLSDCRGYLIVVTGSHEAPTLRTFLIGSAQDREKLLQRETLVTAGATEAAHPVDRLCAFDVAGEIVAQSLRDNTGLDVGQGDLVAMAGVEPSDVSDCSNPVDFALAYGAALALPEKANSVNFRNDHMPYLGKKMRLQKAVRFLSISLTILLLAVGVYFHSQLLREGRYRAALRAKLEPDYLAVMLGEKKLPAPMKTAVNKLAGALRILKANKTGIGGNEELVSAKMTLVLQALNNCARRTDLNIDSITITGKSTVVIGDTSSRQNTLAVHEAMKQAGLELRQNSATPEGRRDSFTIMVEPAKRPQGS